MKMKKWLAKQIFGGRRRSKARHRSEENMKAGYDSEMAKEAYPSNGL